MVLPAPAANFEKIGYNLVKKTPLLTGSPGALLQSQNCRRSGSGFISSISRPAFPYCLSRMSPPTA